MDNQLQDTLRVRLPAILVERLQGVSPQFGKTVFMKMVYLLQEVYNVPLGYRFTLYNYGPYVSDVLSDLDRSKQRGWVNVNYLENELGFEITAGPSSVNVPDAFVVFDEYEEEIKSLVETFGKFRAKELELRTTIICLRKMLGSGNDKVFEQIIEAVHQLKPHFAKPEIERAVQELVAKQLISQ